MREALMIAGLVGLAFMVQRWQAKRALPGAVPAAPSSAASFLSGGNSPDTVLGADQGYGPLRSAWG